MALQPNDFRFTLYSEGKEWVLPQSPDGWEESTLQWARSDIYFGLVRSFSVPLRFVLDGAWLLRRSMYLGGIDASCIIKIELLDRSTWQYETMYEGDIDFSTFDDMLTVVEAKLMDMGIAASVAAYSNVEYEFEVTNEETIPVRLPGIDRIETGDANPFALTAATLGYYPGLQIGTNELFSERVIIQEVDYNNYIPNQPVPGNGWFIEGQDPTTNIRISGYWDYFTFVVANTNYYYQLELIGEFGNIIAVLFSTLGNPPTQTRSNFDVNIDVSAGQKLWIIVRRYGSGGSIVFPFLRTDGGVINVSYGITTEPTVIRAFRPKKVFQMLMDRMHPEGVTVQSELLDRWDNLLITSGDAIRTISGALLKTKFDDFFRSINAVLNAGFGVYGNVPSIEGKDYYYRRSGQVIDLGDSVKEVHVRPSESYLFNSIKAGYPNDDYEVDQGREEYNSGQIWSTDIRRIQKQIDLSSIYRADQYGIEQLRISVLDNQRDNVNEVDKKNDNELFFVHAKKEPGEDGIFDVIGAENYVNISGISARSSSYNMEITPKKNLLRHANYLAGSMYNNSSVLSFESADKNADLSTTDLNGITVRERDNIDVSTLGEPLFLPFEVEFVTDLDFNAWRMMQTSPFGYVKFMFRGSEFYGFITEVSQNIVRNQERTFTLLLSPNSDISKLID